MLRISRVFIGIVILVMVVQWGFALGNYKALTWSVGQWASFTMNDGQKDYNMKFSIVGTESIEGKTYYWFETKMDMGKDPVVSKMLISISDMKPKKFIVKQGKEPAMDMTAMLNMGGMMNQFNRRPPVHNESAINEGFIGMESVIVPGGTFNALHSKVKDADTGDLMEVWVSGDVPINGMVKSIGKSGKRTSTLTLTGYGKTGAKTEITETPQKFDMPDMSGMRQNQ